MQPWMSAAQQSQQNAVQAAQHTARSGMDAGRAAAEAAQRGSARTMHTSPSYRRAGSGGDGSGFFTLVLGLIKLAMLVATIFVAVKLIGGV